MISIWLCQCHWLQLYSLVAAKLPRTHNIISSNLQRTLTFGWQPPPVNGCSAKPVGLHHSSQTTRGIICSGRPPLSKFEVPVVCGPFQYISWHPTFPPSIVPGKQLLFRAMSTRGTLSMSDRNSQPYELSDRFDRLPSTWSYFCQQLRLK